MLKLCLGEVGGLIEQILLERNVKIDRTLTIIGHFH